MKAAARWLINNFPLMVMAFLLALLAWFVALEQADPTMEKLYPQPVPVASPEPPQGMLIVGTFNEQVQVTLRAPQSIWQDLEVDDFDATVDLTGLSEGTHKVPVQVKLDKEPSRIVNYEPDEVTLDLDLKAERKVPVRIEPQGEPALGYDKRMAIANPEEVSVKGPMGYVTRVVRAFAAVSVQDADADVEAKLEVRPQDDEGNSVPYATLEPGEIDVRIPIEPSDYHRPLAVRVVLTGEVASGYRVKDISAEPPVITVFGTPAVLDELPGFIETKPIDIQGAQDDVVARPALNVPQSVSVVPGQEVRVRVNVDAIESSLTMKIAPELQGLSPGLTSTVSPETVEVIVSGPLPVLDKLKPEDVRVVLDLFELSVGTHQIEPQVIVPEKVTAQSVIPSSLQVEISAGAVPTPTSRVPVTATATITN